jgi:hypothetical protein
MRERTDPRPTRWRATQARTDKRNGRPKDWEPSRVELAMTSNPGVRRVLQEGSIVTSLRELARLEERRLESEREARARLVEAAEAERREADRREVEARADAERKAEEAWLARARREREEAAQVAAIEAATIERARREADAKIASDEREREHRRDLELAAATRGAREGRLGRALVGAIALLVAFAVATGWSYGGLLPREAARVASATDAIAARDLAIESLRADLAARDEAIAASRKDTEAAESRARALASELERVRRERQASGPRRTPVPQVVDHGPVSGFDTHCDPSSHDPLCANIAR